MIARLELPPEVEVQIAAVYPGRVPFTLTLTEASLHVAESVLWSPRPGAMVRLAQGARVALRGTVAQTLPLPWSQAFGGER